MPERKNLQSSFSSCKQCEKQSPEHILERSAAFLYCSRRCTSDSVSRSTSPQIIKRTNFEEIPPKQFTPRTTEYTPLGHSRQTDTIPQVLCDLNEITGNLSNFRDQLKEFYNRVGHVELDINDIGCKLKKVSPSYDDSPLEHSRPTGTIREVLYDLKEMTGNFSKFRRQLLKEFYIQVVDAELGINDIRSKLEKVSPSYDDEPFRHSRLTGTIRKVLHNLNEINRNFSNFRNQLKEFYNRVVHVESDINGIRGLLEKELPPYDDEPFRHSRLMGTIRKVLYDLKEMTRNLSKFRGQLLNEFYNRVVDVEYDVKNDIIGKLEKVSPSYDEDTIIL